MLYRFTRTLVVVSAGAVLLLFGTGAGWPAFVALGVVVAVATAQHAALSATYSRRMREIIRREDPDRPSEVGEVAAAVRERVAEERMSAERQNADLRAALESTSVGVVIVSGDGRVLNTVGSLIGLIDTGRDARIRHPALLRMIERVIASGETRVETLAMGPRGEVKQWVAVPLGDEAVGAVVTDVTEVQRVQAMRTNFVADASHELKTPIAAIQAAAEALQAAIGRDQGQAVHFAKRLEEQSVRLGRLVTDLLDLSRLEAEPMKVESFSLSDAVRVEIEAVGAEATKSGIRIIDDLADVSLVGSDRDVRLAVRNLLTNAVRYSPSGATVQVRLFSDGGGAVIEVTDSGWGIPLSDQEHVFERFYRVDSARSRETGGTGLGLSIVRHVARNHGGVVEVESVLGEGSTFRLWLPTEDH